MEEYREYKTKVRLTEVEHINNSEVATVYFDYDCSWTVEDGALFVRHKSDSKVIATFARNEWQYIREADD